MAKPRYVEINGRRFLWRELMELRRAQTIAKAEQPALFEMRQDSRPRGDRTARERYEAPNLLDYIASRKV